MKKVHELMDSPEKWGQGELAIDAKGDPVDPLGPEGVCRCAMGWLLYVYRDSDQYTKATIKALDEVGLNSIVDWNDAPGRTFEEVRDLFRRLDL